jgi:hypothetical protein
VAGNEGLAWQTSKNLNGVAIETYEVAVLVGDLLYSFVLQTSKDNYAEALQHMSQMLKSATFNR